MIFDAFKPYLYGAAAVALVASYAGLWIYRGNIDATATKAALEQEQNNEYQSYLAYDKAIQTASQIAADKAKADGYRYQSELASANARAISAADTSSKLQHAFSLYADGGWFKAPGEASACIPISDANARLGLLAHDASLLDADGLRASKGAAECAVRLTACERWKDTVESEFPISLKP